MAVVKLPSGRTVKVPDDLTQQQVMEHLFDNLPKDGKWEDDRSKIGDRLNTSGWGKAIGGGIGGFGGAVGGIFTSPSIVANPITLGMAGSAAGSAIGEGIEQWITGKGDWDDIGWAGGEGLAWGIIPGAGGQAIKTARRLGAGNLTSGIVGTGTNVAAGAAAGGGTAAVTGGDPKTGALVGGGLGLTGLGIFGKAGTKVLNELGKKVGLDKPAKSAYEIGQDAAKKFADGKFQTLTGRVASGQMTVAQAKFQLTRDVANYIIKNTRNIFRKNTGKAPSQLQEQGIKTAAEKQTKEWLDYQDFKKVQDKLMTPKPKYTQTTVGGKKVWMREDDAGNKFITDKIGGKETHIGKHYEDGGRVETNQPMIQNPVVKQSQTDRHGNEATVEYYDNGSLKRRFKKDRYGNTQEEVFGDGEALYAKNGVQVPQVGDGMVPDLKRKIREDLVQYKNPGGFVSGFQLPGMSPAPNLGTNQETLGVISNTLKKLGIPDPSWEDVLSFLSSPARHILSTEPTNIGSTSLETPVEDSIDTSKLYSEEDDNYINRKIDEDSPSLKSKGIKLRVKQSGKPSHKIFNAEDLKHLSDNDILTLEEYGTGQLDFDEKLKVYKEVLSRGFSTSPPVPGKTRAERDAELKEKWSKFTKEDFKKTRDSLDKLTPEARKKLPQWIKDKLRLDKDGNKGSYHKEDGGLMGPLSNPGGYTQLDLFNESEIDYGNKSQHPGGPKGIDTIPAWLAPGEFVTNQEGTEIFGDTLEMINDIGLEMRKRGFKPDVSKYKSKKPPLAGNK